MPLTPEDVRNKQFTTVRLREGYDEDEVDAFLDEVEAELTRLLRENEDLRAKLAAATRAAAQNQQNMRKPPEPQDQQGGMPQQGGMQQGGMPQGGMQQQGMQQGGMQQQGMQQGGSLDNMEGFQATEVSQGWNDSSWFAIAERLQ
ncbi:DivIVA domain-containing protein, partial [Streptomyces sp. NPDC002920]